MLILFSQQFCCIFQVKYLSNDSSNQYGTKVILDIFVSFLNWLRLIHEVK